MNKYDLSILIPSRNEMFLAKTVESLLKNIRGKTEIIVVLDGKWANPQVPDDPRLTMVYFPQSIGQRAATNQACRLSQAKYVMKLDAHCDVDEGFDVKLMEDMQDNYTIVPVMRNLHAFDWVCIGNHKLDSQDLYYDKDSQLPVGCGYSKYQGPTPEACPQCKGNMVRLLKWYPKSSPQSTSFRFDKTLHFQYFGEYKKVQDASGSHLVETLSLQGSCFMLTREKYWELNICDENHGSWGQQGVEVALKTWESGGRVVVDKKTWYAHMFRTQGGDFSFPYPLSGKEIDKARKYSRQLFLEGKWEKAIHSLDWVLNKFYPVPGWHDDTKDKNKNAAETEPLASPTVTKEIIFYTDNQLKLKYAHAVQNQLRAIGIPIISASLKPMPHFGNNIHLPLHRGMEAYFQQIIAALEASRAEIVYMCEADVLYHPSHFEFIPPTSDHFYYNVNFWRVRPETDNLAVHWDAPQVSGLVCYREFLLSWYKKKWEKIQRDGFDRSYEPGGRDKELVKIWRSKLPNIDIRHGNNLTKSKWSIKDFRDKSTCINWQETTADKIEGWNYTPERLFTSL